nr:hypothetical protein [Tanacetum cinerariifolium]
MLKRGSMADGRERGHNSPDENKPIRHGRRGDVQEVISISNVEKRLKNVIHAKYMPGAKTLEDTFNIHHVSMVVIPMRPKHLRIPSRGPWFRLSRVIVIDKGTQLVNDAFKSWCEKWKIKQMNTAVVHPQANGLVERANKSPMHGLKTRLGRERVGWVDELSNILWAHRTMMKTSNGETPFNLTYERKKGDSGNPRRKIQKKVEQYYNKRVMPISFKVGDFVYKRNEASRVENQGKLRSNWEGPYRIVEAYDNGSYNLCTMNEQEVPHTWHRRNGQDYDSTPNLLKKSSFRRWRRRRQLLRRRHKLIKTASGVSRRRQNEAASNETLEASSK